MKPSFMQRADIRDAVTADLARSSSGELPIKRSDFLSLRSDIKPGDMAGALQGYQDAYLDSQLAGGNDTRKNMVLVTARKSVETIGHLTALADRDILNGLLHAAKQDVDTSLGQELKARGLSLTNQTSFDMGGR